MALPTEWVNPLQLKLFLDAGVSFNYDDKLKELEAKYLAIRNHRSEVRHSFFRLDFISLNNLRKYFVFTLSFNNFIIIVKSLKVRSLMNFTVIFIK